MIDRRSISITQCKRAFAAHDILYTNTKYYFEVKQRANCRHENLTPAHCKKTCIEWPAYGGTNILQPSTSLNNSSGASAGDKVVTILIRWYRQQLGDN